MISRRLLGSLLAYFVVIHCTVKVHAEVKQVRININEDGDFLVPKAAETHTEETKTQLNISTTAHMMNLTSSKTDTPTHTRSDTRTESWTDTATDPVTIEPPPTNTSTNVETVATSVNNTATELITVTHTSHSDPIHNVTHTETAMTVANVTTGTTGSTGTTATTAKPHTTGHTTSTSEHTTSTSGHTTSTSGHTTHTTGTTATTGKPPTTGHTTKTVTTGKTTILITTGSNHTTGKTNTTGTTGSTGSGTTGTTATTGTSTYTSGATTMGVNCHQFTQCESCIIDGDKRCVWCGTQCQFLSPGNAACTRMCGTNSALTSGDIAAISLAATTAFIGFVAGSIVWYKIYWKKRHYYEKLR